MFDNLFIVAAIIIILWLGLFILYLFSSRQQHTLKENLQALEEKLDSDQNVES